MRNEIDETGALLPYGLMLTLLLIAVATVMVFSILLLNGSVPADSLQDHCIKNPFSDQCAGIGSKKAMRSPAPTTS